VTETAAIPVDDGGAGRRVSDAMHRGLVHCSPEASLREVAALMWEQRVHCVIVTEDPAEATALWGVVFDSDLVAASTVRALDEQRAGGTAMKPAVTALPHDTLDDAARRMTTQGVSHLVVVDEIGKRPLGVLSTLDLARVLSAT
jgi:CBS domain-containing protein